MDIVRVGTICRALRIKKRWRQEDLGERAGVTRSDVSRLERGVIDILAWHAATRTLLVIELKTEIVDLNELMGTVDRKRRLAAVVARERGWVPSLVAVWIVVGEQDESAARADSRGDVTRGLPARRAAGPALAPAADRGARLSLLLVKCARGAR